MRHAAFSFWLVSPHWFSTITGAACALPASPQHSTAQHSTVQHSTTHETPLLASAGDDLASAVAKYDRERLPDAHGLVDIESSFSKLVGNKLVAALDPKFLKLVVHVVFGESDCCFKHSALLHSHCTLLVPWNCSDHMALSWSHGIAAVTWCCSDHMALLQSLGAVPIT